MANLPQRSVNYPGTLAPLEPDRISPQQDRTTVPHTPPMVASPTPPRYPQPNYRHDQMNSPSMNSQNLLSPSSGVRTPSPIPRLSTPPGPPVFNSPVKPAAVPFLTSPATPQPMAYSSATTSSLPVSTTYYANGSSAGSQHDLLDVVRMEEPIAVDSSYVLFSANKVLKQKKLANIASLGFGAIVSVGKESIHGPQIIHRDPHRCLNCGAYSNPYSSIYIGSGQWQCVICQSMNGSRGEYVASSKDELRNFPELTLPLIDYVQTGNRRPGFVPSSDNPTSAPVILVIDECLDEPHLQHLQSSLHAFVDSLPQTTRLGIVLYGRTVSIYDLSEESVASADVISGEKSLSAESMKLMSYGTGVYLSPMHAPRKVAHEIFSSLTPYTLNIPEASRDRCLGTAVEAALAIIQGPPAEMSQGVVKRPGGTSRIIVCAGGPITYGPGSVPHSMSHPNYPYMEKTAINWMENLGREAHKHDTVVDIMCAGTCPLRVPLLQPLAKASGGVLVLHDDFGEAFGVDLQRAATRAAGSHGVLEVRCSDDILITQVIGPGEEAHSGTRKTFKNDAALCIQMLSVEETQSFSLSMENKRDIKSDHAFFQFVFHYSDVHQANVSRVITFKLPTVDSISEYVQSIAEEAAAVLISKRTLLLAKTQKEAVDVRATIDERIKDIAWDFGPQVTKSKYDKKYKVIKSKVYTFPKILSSLPELLFHLRRGPLLGNIIGHEDERLVLRSLFLNASFDLSLRMVAPGCLMHQEGGTFEEVPAHDLAMQSDKAVILDHGTDVFIWLGAELCADEVKSAAVLAACRTLSEELTEFRFPAPRILAFKEGSSQARYLVCRLIPAHKDSTFEQEERFLQIRKLTTEERGKVKSRFVEFDEESFCEWMTSLKVEPPPG